MPNKKPEEARSFTFVDYDINRRGVTEIARAHLMKDRMRSKREARSEWVTRNQFSPLRWMRPKENGQPDSDLSTTPSADLGESAKGTKSPMSHYAAVIDFQKDSVTLSPRNKKPRSESPRSVKGAKVDKPTNPDVRDSCSEGNSNNRSCGRSPKNCNRLNVRPRSGNSRFPHEDSPGSNVGRAEVEHSPWQSEAKPRRVSLESRSELGLSLIEGLKIEITPTRQPSRLQRQLSDTDEAVTSKVLLELEQSAKYTTVALTPTGCNLIRYFVTNAETMLGLDGHPEIVQKYSPVFQLFVPFAISSHWCFQTMIVLLSAYHRRRTKQPGEPGHLDAEHQYVVCRQNDTLAQTRERICALANHQDSTDEDLVAFLFLALSEYCAGNRQIGRMHFKAWREYCEMRRILGIKPCGLPCKTIVWWCLSMLVENDVSLDSIINPATRARVREDPEKLFRYVANYPVETILEGGHRLGPGKLDRRVSC